MKSTRRSSSACRSDRRRPAGARVTAWLTLTAALIAVGVPAATHAPQAADSAAAVRAALAAATDASAATGSPRALRRHTLMLERARLPALYARLAYAPLWSRAGAATAQAVRLLGVLEHAEDFGLVPADYQSDWLSRNRPDAPAVRRSNDPAAWASWDLQLSAALLAFIEDLHEGRIDPAAAGFELSADSAAYRPFDAPAVLGALASSPDPQTQLARIEPTYRHYRLLEQALPRYRQLASAPGLTDLPRLPVRLVRIGQFYAGAPALRRLLSALGYLPASVVPDSAILDAPLVRALTVYQSTHGLAADGVLGEHTLASLRVPLSNRVRQIELTLERWRWLPPMRARTLMVNIPEYRLFAFEGPVDAERDMLRMAVIVGQDYRHTRTPVFMADMRTVVFRPYWDVPRSIVLREILPQLARDPAYLASEHLELVDGPRDDSPVVPPDASNLRRLAAGALRLRQRPGADNALGLVKFLLPNAHDVYLHDTPAARLFAQSRRTFSHGCIRVADPVSLALYALRGTPGVWSEDAIRAAMHGTQTRRVTLAQPVHVMILYGTAIADEAGQLHFLDDVYGEDRRLATLLGLPEPHPAGIDVHEVGRRVIANTASGQ